MIPEIESRRRALLVIYRRYLIADRALHLARREAVSWFPVGARPPVPPIGDPGSRLRRLYDRRNRFLDQLTLLHREIETARRAATPRLQILALPPA